MAGLARDLLDSPAGNVLATALHSLGAIGLLGGLVAYVLWHRHLRQGHHHPRVIAAAAALTYIAIVANLAGGFLRTYQGGHPTVADIGESPWVRVMVLKHLFIFLGMGAAIYALEAIVPKALRAWRAKALDGLSPLGHQAAVTLVGLSILVAAILGAVAGVTPLREGEDTGMDGEGDGDGHGDAPPDGHDGHAAGRTYYDNTTGQLTSTPAAPAYASGTFEVPERTQEVAFILAWDPAQFALGLEVTDPKGATTRTAAVADGQEEGAVGSAAQPPLAGTWRFRVFADGDLALNVQWELSIWMPQAPSDESLLADSVLVAPGQFYEINTQMPRNGTLHWDWTAAQAVHFDVHSHFDGEVQYHVEQDTAAHAGRFTNQRAGGYSLLWANEGALPIRLDYRVWGEYELDSIFPAAGFAP